MAIPQTQIDLFNAIVKKASLKQEIYHQSIDVFSGFKRVAESMSGNFKLSETGNEYGIGLEFREISRFEFEIQFGGDVLVFFLHSNVFEIPRDHEVMKLSYIKEDKSRSYCSIIHIFNFLNDSFKYNRITDVGYLIGRVFVNRERHYFIEGKREVGLLFNNFPDSMLDEESAESIIRSSILYTINFDLLTPPYDNMKEVTIEEMLNIRDSMRIKTGKRLGFKFQEDKAGEE
ncbi:MAG: hypothetical protein WCL00_09285 [Bacteroidota bacterium]